MGLQRCLTPEQKVTPRGMCLPLASHCLTLHRRVAAPGAGCGQGVPGCVGCPQEEEEELMWSSSSMGGWVVVMTWLEQKSHKVRQGGDQYWISANE